MFTRTLVDFPKTCFLFVFLLLLQKKKHPKGLTATLVGTGHWLGHSFIHSFSTDFYGFLNPLWGPGPLIRLQTEIPGEKQLAVNSSQVQASLLQNCLLAGLTFYVCLLFPSFLKQVWMASLPARKPLECFPAFFACKAIAY